MKKNVYSDRKNPKSGENIFNPLNSSDTGQAIIYDYKKTISNQKVVYTLFNEINKNDYDLIFMKNIDEHLVIKNNSLKHYLSLIKFKKFDFIKNNLVMPRDNNLLRYNNKTLIERYKCP